MMLHNSLNTMHT